MGKCICGHACFNFVCGQSVDHKPVITSTSVSIILLFVFSFVSLLIFCCLPICIVM